MTINEWRDYIHLWAVKKGFWYTLEDSVQHASGNTLSALMLVVSELGEAAEAVRNSDDANLREEIADSIIRLLDLAGGLGIDIERVMWDKMAFNEGRPYRHGKSC